MRLLALLVMLWAAPAAAQTREVRPDQLSLRVEVETVDAAPFAREMVLLTIHGVYRRHITREALQQPDLAGFNWMQLGEDHWFDSRVDGLKVKNFRRRMALFPEAAGSLTIGPFVHRLTLTDEGDDWFEHDVASAPLTIDVRPAPVADDSWFPVRQLRISDRWSNPPDQLQEGEGVLRVIHLEAVGASPEMLPPMPELRSPSAMIFAHPEKRLVNLSPDGPVAHAFWRWTIRPGNGTSGILEPLTFDYFDTTTRQAQTVTITAQRVAMERATVVGATGRDLPAGRLHGRAVTAFAIVALLCGIAALVLGRRVAVGGAGLPPLLDPLARALRRVARRGDLPAMRRAAAALIERDGTNSDRCWMLHELDAALFGGQEAPADMLRFAGAFIAARPEPSSAPRLTGRRARP